MRRWMIPTAMLLLCATLSACSQHGKQVVMSKNEVESTVSSRQCANALVASPEVIEVAKILKLYDLTDAKFRALNPDIVGDVVPAFQSVVVSKSCDRTEKRSQQGLSRS